MINVTKAAEKGLAELLESKGLDPSKYGLRLSVEKGGCAGMQYNLTVSTIKSDDHVVLSGLVSIFLDSKSVSYYEGCTLDYCNDLTASGFRILNPRAIRSCGCGTSFEPSS